MKEDLVSYIWRYKLWTNIPLTTQNGEVVEVIDCGLPNNDAGPDYFNAKVKIGETTWAGNVEIHVRASDWSRHKHENDEAYNNVVLHVVAQSDTVIKNAKGEEVPQVELQIPVKYVQLAEQLIQSQQAIACGKYWDDKLKARLELMLNGLVCERLENKVTAIQEILGSNQNNWEETFYQILARSFGMKVNNEAFYQTARSLPQSYLGKQKDNLLQIEALLMGQAGLLENVEKTDEYINSLITEYKFLKAKYNLSPINRNLWKMGRIRPANSPWVRLAELAMLVHHSEHLFMKTVGTKDVKSLHELFTFNASDYWQTHYHPAEESPKSDKKIGESLRNSLLINCVVPMLFAYGKHTGNEALKERAFDLLNSLPAEENSISKIWSEYGFTPKNAYDTQALLEQKKNYCDKKDCLRCKLGYQVIKKTIQQ
ncbi:MAG: DUF2851 family protein [Paludibacteraceae bacterium]|nr:DUF2851 family protein [Paludibacteraceae bacterium]